MVALLNVTTELSDRTSASNVSEATKCELALHMLQWHDSRKSQIRQIRSVSKRCNAQSKPAGTSQCATMPVAFGVRGWLCTGPFCGAPLASPADDLLGAMLARFMLDPGTMVLTPSP